MPSPGDLHLYDAHAAAGARFGERQTVPVVGGYGDPRAEYAAMIEGVAVVDLPHRGVLGMRGPAPARTRFLQGMLSNDVAALAPGEGCLAAMLSSRGGVFALVRALAEADEVLLETHAGRVGPLQRELERYRVAAPVRLAPRPVTVLAVVGPRAEAALREAGAAGLPTAPESHSAATLGGAVARVARAGDLPGGGFVLHVPLEGSLAVWSALLAAGARPAGVDALDARRVELLRPWWGDDVTEENLLHETGLVPECVSFTKGCYVGQEVVARLDARGARVSRALRRLRLAAPVASGARVTVGGDEAGRVTTAAVSPRLGPVALAYVHRNHFAPGTAVVVEGVAGAVVTELEEAPPGGRE